MSSTAAFLRHFAKALLMVFALMLASLAISLTPIVLDVSGNEVVYAREFIGLEASFPEMEEGTVERIDDAAHMDVALGKFYPKVRLIGVRLPGPLFGTDSVIYISVMLILGSLGAVHSRTTIKRLLNYSRA